MLVEKIKKPRKSIYCEDQQKITKETKSVTQEQFIIELFCRVDDMLGKTPEHVQAKLSISELVTLGLLFALKGSSQRAFYRWVKQNWSSLFPRLPERTRLFRRLKTHRQITEKFLAEPTVFGVIDSDGIELCHPIRERHQPHRKRIGKKGFASWKWIVGGKLCLLVNKFGLITGWSVKTANVSDQEYLPLVEAVSGQMVVLADNGCCSAGKSETVSARTVERPNDHRNGFLFVVAGMSAETFAPTSFGIFRDAARFYGRYIQPAAEMERFEF